MKTRKCKDCEETQPIENFDKDYRGCTRTRCRPCQKLAKAKQKKKYYDKNKDAIAKQAEAYRRSLGVMPREVGGIHDTTICRVCEVIIPQEELSASYKGRRRAICKPCGSEQSKKRYRENPEIRERHRQRYLDNREEAIVAATRWKKENPQKVKVHKKKQRDKLHVKVRRRQSKRISTALKSVGNRKEYSVLKYLGCTATELIQHLEGQFQEGMSWDNYGVNEENWKLAWHIDHIKPLASFDLSQESEQMDCFNYTNLQPLWAEENLKKSDSYDEEND